MVSRCLLNLFVTWLLILTWSWDTAGQESPCPDEFRYETDPSGTWYGVITVPSPYPNLAIDITVEIYITARIPQDRKATLELVDKNAWKKLASGDRNPISYRLNFPLQSPLPTIKGITVNQNIICTGSKPRSPFLITLTMKHAIFDDRCSSSSLQCPFNIKETGETNQLIPVFKPPPPPPNLLPETNEDVFSSTTSPCPDVFKYELDDFGNWYGLISVPNPYPIVAIDIRVSIYIAAHIPPNRKGKLHLINNIYDEWRRMRTGENYSILYRLDFPVTSPLPTIKNIIVNNNVICSGNDPGSSTLGLTTLSFQHGIFSDKCASASLDCPYNTEQSFVRPKPPPVEKPMLPPPPPPYKPEPPRERPPPPTQKPEPPRERPPPPPTQKPEPPRERPPPPTQKPEPPPNSPNEEAGGGINTNVQCGQPVVKVNKLIFYGEDTTRGEWPWHAALYHFTNYNMVYICGGSFVGTRTIVTAAHCVSKNGKALDARDFVVFLGKYNLKNRKEEDSQDFDVSSVFVHPSYNSTNLQADVALLYLSSTVQITTTVRPVCLWDQDDIVLANIVGQQGVIVGWGLDEKGETADKLKMVKMPVVDQQTCLWSHPTFFSQFTSSTTFCAGFRNGSSVCNGDSGGGMMFPRKQKDGTEIWALRGIVSISKPKENTIKVCDTTNYIVFTDAAQYLNWIYTLVI